MKTIKTIFAAVLVALFLAPNVNAKNENEVANNYTIEESSSSTASSNHLLNDGNSYKIYFESMDSPMNVSVTKHEEGANFIVSNGEFEVMYRLRGNVFGVTYVNENDATISRDEMYKKINRTSFLHQNVITQTPKSEKEYVQLIASYVPDLVK